MHSDLHEGLILKSLQLYQRLGFNQSSLAHKVTPRTGKLLSDFCMQGSNNDCLMVIVDMSGVMLKIIAWVNRHVLRLSHSVFKRPGRFSLFLVRFLLSFRGKMGKDV